MTNDKYDELYDLVQCEEQEDFTEEFKKLTSDEHKEFLTQFIIDYYECALQCEVSKDNKTIQKIVDAVIKIADTVENIVDWIFGEAEEPDLEQYFDEIEGDTNE